MCDFSFHGSAVKMFLLAKLPAASVENSATTVGELLLSIPPINLMAESTYGVHLLMNQLAVCLQ